MPHDYGAQRRDTFQTFKMSKGVSLPKTAVVEFAFFIEELDASWPAFERALRLAGFSTRRLKDGETLIASFGHIGRQASQAVQSSLIKRAIVISCSWSV